MQLKGVPPNEMIDQSRKKDTYFDEDYKPIQKTRDNKTGLLIQSGSLSLEELVKSDDALFLDFVSKCLELNPEHRFNAQ